MHDLISARWSARGYDPTAELSDDHLEQILDAGRWAPTWGRVQPVRFVVGRRGDATFETLAGTVNRGNKTWAPASAALILLCTSNAPEDADLHEYGAVDAGLAVGQMILQAVALGYNGHPMAGFSKQAAREAFGIPEDLRPMVIVAVGKLTDDPSTLTDEIRERDAWPRERLPLDEIAFAGQWGQSYRSV